MIVSMARESSADFSFVVQAAVAGIISNFAKKNQDDKRHDGEGENAVGATV